MGGQAGWGLRNLRGPGAQRWARGAIGWAGGRAGRQAAVLGGSAGAPGQWLVTRNGGKTQLGATRTVGGQLEQGQMRRGGER